MTDRPARPASGSAIVLAGGAGRRLGGVAKPALRVGGRALLDTALAAVAGYRPIVVVGGAGRAGGSVPDAVVWTREEPAGAGPAAAVVHGLAMLTDLEPAAPPGAVVALLAADLPAVTPATVERLAAAVSAGFAAPVEPADGAVLVDAGGRDQLLIGVWRRAALVAAAARHPSWTDRALRELLAGLMIIRVPAVGDDAADIDTPDDVRRWGAT